MKNINSKKQSVDVMQEAKLDPEFYNYVKDAEVKIRLSVEVYKMREQKGLSQTQLAKLVKSTQKVISKIENAEVNIGINLLNRLAECLDFNVKNWSNIFGFFPNNMTVTLEYKGANNIEGLEILSKIDHSETCSVKQII